MRDTTALLPRAREERSSWRGAALSIAAVVLALGAVSMYRTSSPIDMSLSTSCTSIAEKGACQTSSSCQWRASDSSCIVTLDASGVSSRKSASADDDDDGKTRSKSSSDDDDGGKSSKSSSDDDDGKSSKSSTDDEDDGKSSKSSTDDDDGKSRKSSGDDDDDGKSRKSSTDDNDATLTDDDAFALAPADDGDDDAGGPAHRNATRHVVFIYVDDQGYNDMGPTSTDLSDLTPNIMALADDGIWLGRYYGMYLCTPSRAALLTGLYPVRTGTQHSLLSGNAPWGLPLRHEVLPTTLKRVDPNTKAHIVGKWHLGHFSTAYTPTRRGFDTFFGFFSGFEDYFVHVAEKNAPQHMCQQEHDCFYDLRDDDTPLPRLSGEFSVDRFDARAAQVIADHVRSTPLFLYYAIPLVHAPIQAPTSVLKKHKRTLSRFGNHERKVFAAQTLMLDASVATVVAALDAAGLSNDTLLVLASDNGALPSSAGSNWPLRGMKGYYFEGAIRTHALVHSPLLPARARGTTYDGYFCTIDWLPTLISGFHGRPDVLPPDIDGIDLWKALIGNHADDDDDDDATATAPPRRRHEILVNIDVVHVDTCSNGTVVTTPGGECVNASVPSGALIEGDLKLLVNVQLLPIWPVPSGHMPSHGGPDNTWDLVNAQYETYLFNITEDPTESHDLKERMPGALARLRARFNEFNASSVAAAYCAETKEDNELAHKLFNVTQFITPGWRDASYVCPDDAKSDPDAWATAWRRDYCAYDLLPSSECPPGIGMVPST